MIFMVPQSLITVSLTTAIFTRMAGAVADGDDRAVADSYHLGVRTITSLTLVAAAMLMARLGAHDGDRDGRQGRGPRGRDRLRPRPDIR